MLKEIKRIIRTNKDLFKNGVMVSNGFVFIGARDFVIRINSNLIEEFENVGDEDLFIPYEDLDQLNGDFTRFKSDEISYYLNVCDRSTTSIFKHIELMRGWNLNGNCMDTEEAISLFKLIDRLRKSNGSRERVININVDDKISNTKIAIITLPEYYKTDFQIVTRAFLD